MLYLGVNKKRKAEHLTDLPFKKSKNNMRAKIHKVCLYGQTTFKPHSQKNKRIFNALA